ncbi:anti-sigma factor family protein [Thermoflavimicrobium dichotomicum]|uniref:Putative zinc-finger n=1 Tax=Thermoflavimicrobium dichotomicum TaxID=46223 RepID=A0A1I3MKU1_9BACL|nr:zf-HC2 domain-containing protein [Thermoflavimicrobium dichotomicum]SFI97335.1 Putative zinc-finger [Thermoflavimicrobium dichotomicum]
MMSLCKEMEHLIQLYFDEEINEADSIKLKDHLTGCPKCRADFFDMAGLIRELETIGDEERRRQRRVFFPVKWAMICFTLVLCISVSLRSGYPTWKFRMLQEKSSQYVADKRIHLREPMVSVRYNTKDCVQKVHYIQDFERKPCLFTWTQRKKSGLWQTNQLVIIKVPDRQSLEAVLLLMGIHMNTAEIGQKNVKFPASFRIKAGKKPEIQPIYDPLE